MCVSNTRLGAAVGLSLFLTTSDLTAETMKADRREIGEKAGLELGKRGVVPRKEEGLRSDDLV